MQVRSIILAAAGAVAVLAAASPAHADWDRHHGRPWGYQGGGYGHWRPHNAPRAYYPPRVYYAPPPVYYAPPRPHFYQPYGGYHGYR